MLQTREGHQLIKDIELRDPGSELDCLDVWQLPCISTQLFGGQTSPAAVMTSAALPVAASASGEARKNPIPKATLPLTFKWLQHADDWPGFGPDEQALLFGHLRFRNAAVQAGSGAAKTRLSRQLAAADNSAVGEHDDARHNPPL